MSAAAPVTYASQVSPAAGSFTLRIIEVSLRLPVVAMFAIAGWGKLDTAKSIERFAREIRAYEMMWVPLTNIMAFTLPAVELTCAALLLAGLWRREVRSILLVMLAIFTVAKAVALSQNLPIDCGCVAKDSVLYPYFSGMTGLYTNLVMLVLLIAGLLIDFALQRCRAVNSPSTPAAPASADAQ